MNREQIPDFFEKFDDNKLSEMIKSAWKIADASAKQKYGKIIGKTNVEEAQAIASEVLDDFKIEKGEPARMEYRADIVAALTTGDREKMQDEPENKTPWQEIGYS